MSIDNHTGRAQWLIPKSDPLSSQLIQIWGAITSIFRNRDTTGRTTNPTIRTGGVPTQPTHKRSFVDPNKTIIRQNNVFINPQSDGIYEVVYVPPQTTFSKPSSDRSGPAFRPDSLAHRYKRQDRLSEKQETDIESRRVPVRPHYMNKNRRYIPMATQTAASQQDYFWNQGEKRPWIYYKVRTTVRGFQRQEDGSLQPFTLPYIVFTRVIESD